MKIIFVQSYFISPISFLHLKLQLTKMKIQGQSRVIPDSYMFRRYFGREKIFQHILEEIRR